MFQCFKYHMQVIRTRLLVINIVLIQFCNQGGDLHSFRL